MHTHPAARQNIATHNRPRLGELATLHPKADAHAFQIGHAFAERFGSVAIEGHVEVVGVPNWYNVAHHGGIVVYGHIVSRGSVDYKTRVFYVQRSHGWEELTDLAQLLS
jgi:hypothetical protein